MDTQLDIQKALFGAMIMGLLFTKSMDGENDLGEMIEQVINALLSQKVGIQELLALMLIAEKQGDETIALADARRAFQTLRKTVKRITNGDSTGVSESFCE